MNVPKKVNTPRKGWFKSNQFKRIHVLTSFCFASDPQRKTSVSDAGQFEKKNEFAPAGVQAGSSSRTFHPEATGAGGKVQSKKLYRLKRKLLHSQQGRGTYPSFHFHWVLFCGQPIQKSDHLLYIDLRPGQTCHSKVMHRKELTYSDGSYEKKSRRWTWLTIWDKVKSHDTLIDWCTGREWPMNCMTVISAWWRSNMPFQRLSGRLDYHITRWRQEVS